MNERQQNKRRLKEYEETTYFSNSSFACKSGVS